MEVCHTFLLMWSAVTNVVVCGSLCTHVRDVTRETRGLGVGALVQPACGRSTLPGTGSGGGSIGC